jgi:DNA-binding Lrp family transcriptional regulator
MSRSWDGMCSREIYCQLAARSPQNPLDKDDYRVKHAYNRIYVQGSRMDHFDVKLLQALQSDGRLSNFELAELVGLSASQCSRRRAALEDAGTIASYHAHLDGEALGLGIAVFVQVTLATHSPDNSRQFLKLIETLDEVQEAYALTGEADYLIKVTITDLKALSRLLNEVFLPHKSVAHVRSSIVLDRLKQTSELPLGHLRLAQNDPARSARSSRSRGSGNAGSKRAKNG